MTWTTEPTRVHRRVSCVIIQRPQIAQISWDLLWGFDPIESPPRGIFAGGKKGLIKIIRERKGGKTRDKAKVTRVFRAGCCAAVNAVVCFYEAVVRQHKKPRSSKTATEITLGVLIMPLRHRRLCKNNSEWMACILTHRTLHRALRATRREVSQRRSLFPRFSLNSGRWKQIFWELLLRSIASAHQTVSKFLRTHLTVLFELIALLCPFISALVSSEHKTSLSV